MGVTEGVVVPDRSENGSGADVLARRREWYEVFPHGTIEFIMVTHALTLLLLVVLPVVRSTQRPMVLLALAGMLLADYLLTLWWVVQMEADAALLAEPGAAGGIGPERRRRIGRWMVMAIPGTLALAAMGAGQVSTPQMAVGLAVASLVTLVIIRLRFAPGIATSGWAGWLVLIPLLHFPAVHRFAFEIEERIRAARAPGAGAAEEPGSPVVRVLAGVLWVLTAAAWIGVAVRWRMGLTWPEVLPSLLLPIGGVLFAMPLAVADIAVLEHAQRLLLRGFPRGGSKPTR